MTDTAPDRIAADIESILDRDDLGALSDTVCQLIEDEYSFEAAVERYRSILTAVSSL